MMLELRGQQYQMNAELEEMKTILKSQKASKTGIWETFNQFSSRATIMPVLMMTVFMMLQEATGYFTVSMYALDIFKRVNVPMNNHMLAILVNGGCIIGYVISAFLVRCVLRKVHFISSGLFMAVSTITLGFTLQPVTPFTITCCRYT